MKPNNMNIKKTIIGFLLAIVALLGGGYTVNNLGSARVSDAYQATTTPQVADMANLCPSRSGQPSFTTGILGAVNVLNANTSAFTIYDATTTNITLRGNLATSSLILAEFPGSPTEGSYHLDVEFKQGLLVDYATTATVSTTTISYRCQG